MRLNDFFREALEYRDIDRAAREAAEVEIAAKKPVYETCRLSGRCANGNERDGGYIYHAVARGSWIALCGKKPGRTSGGWCENLEAQVTCPKCKRLLERQ
jgi:hypothetical protein